MESASPSSLDICGALAKLLAAGGRYAALGDRQAISASENVAIALFGVSSCVVPLSSSVAESDELIVCMFETAITSEKPWDAFCASSCERNGAARLSAIAALLYASVTRVFSSALAAS